MRTLSRSALVPCLGPCLLLALALAFVGSAVFASRVASADGSASDDAKPATWVGAPTSPLATPCRFGITHLTSWKAQGEDTKNTCNARGAAASLSHPLCAFVDHCESYSNAALLGSEIWGYTWSDDSLLCQFDECATVDTAGYSCEIAFYTVNPMAGCSATISAALYPQFRWRIMGYGNVEVEVAGAMHCQGSDLVFPVTTVSGGKAAYVGSRCDCAPSTPSGTLSIGEGPLQISVPLSTFDAPSLPMDESVVGCLTTNVAPPVPLGLLGELVTFRGYVKVRSYADEPATSHADVQGWVRDADPGLRVILRCQGAKRCVMSATSTCMRAAKGR